MGEECPCELASAMAHMYFRLNAEEAMNRSINHSMEDLRQKFEKAQSSSDWWEVECEKRVKENRKLKGTLRHLQERLAHATQGDGSCEKFLFDIGQRVRVAGAGAVIIKSVLSRGRLVYGDGRTRNAYEVEQLVGVFDERHLTAVEESEFEAIDNPDHTEESLADCEGEEA